MKEITRNDKMSHTNAILAVVLPDRNGSYSYYLNECNKTPDCNVRYLNTNSLFGILKDNMFNYCSNDNETYNHTCENCNSNFYRGNSSYIESVKWDDFIKNKNGYLDKAIMIRDNRRAYNITKEIV